MRKKIFISFASLDKKMAMTICTALEARGLPCWISCRDVHGGENYQEKIVAAIRNAGAMLLVFSSNANNSDEIKKEMALASQSHLNVIPVRSEDVVPSGAFSYELATRQWFDLFENWEQAMGDLAAQLDAIVPPDGTAPQPAQPQAIPAPVVAGAPPKPVPPGPKMPWLLIAGLLVASVAVGAVFIPLGSLIFMGTLGYGVYCWGKSRAKAGA